MTAPGAFSIIASTSSLPNVSLTSGEVHNSWMVARRSNMKDAHGPIPLPVATSTTRLKRGKMRTTPQVGIPRTQTCVGGCSICLAVQSPARDTRSEWPRLSGTRIVAKLCHSIRGLSDICVARPGPGEARDVESLCQSTIEIPLAYEAHHCQSICVPRALKARQT